MSEQVLVLNGSRIGDFLRCPRYFRYRQRYRSPFEDTHAVDFGTGIHAALEEWYRPGEDGRPKMDDESAIRAFRAAVDWPAHDAEAKEVETSGYGETLLRRYFDYYRALDADVFRRVHGVELSLAGRVRVDDIDVVLVGRLDAIVEDREGRLWHLQHKTASAYTSPTSYVQGLQLSPHETIYRGLAAAHGIDLTGSIINMLRKMKIPRSGLDSWTPFHRERVVVPGEHCRRWFRHDLRDLAILVADGWDWRNTTACTKWARLCEYHGLCSGLPLDEEDWVAPEPDYVDELRAKIEKGETGLEDIPEIPLDTL